MTGTAQPAGLAALRARCRELRDLLTQMQQLSDQAAGMLLDALPEERRPAAKSPR